MNGRALPSSTQGYGEGMQHHPQEAAAAQDTMDFGKRFREIGVGEGDARDYSVEGRVSERKFFRAGVDQWQVRGPLMAKMQGIEIDIHTDAGVGRISGDEGLTGTAADVKDARAGGQRRRHDVRRMLGISRDGKFALMVFGAQR